MSVIWDKLIECQEQIINIFEKHANEIQEPGLADFNQPDNGWVNRVWANNNVRRAHIDVVDARESKGLWMMHVCIFPVIQNVQRMLTSTCTPTSIERTPRGSAAPCSPP